MSQMKIQILGSGDAFGSGGRFQTCFYVQSETARFLIDCGTTSLVAMKKFGVNPGNIDIILLSHLHGDHFGGIPFLILNAQFSHRQHPLTIAGPPGLENRIHDAMEVFFPGSTRVQRRFTTNFVELEEGRRTLIGSIKVTPYAGLHPSGAPSYALRVECEGKVIGYSGDTEWTHALVQAAAGADLFLCEAYSFDKMIKYHLDYRTLVERRDQLGCQRMILLHMSEDMVHRLQDLDIECAEDDQSIFL